MKTGFPSEGVGPQALETAREAARRSGMSVGEWLDSIIDSAVREGVEAARHPMRNGRPLTAGRGALDAQLAEIKHRIESLAQQLDGGNSEDQQPRSVSRSTPMQHAYQQRTATGGSANSIDQAMMEIAQRRRALDGGIPPAAEAARAPSQNFAGLERQLREITTRMDTLKPCAIDEAVESLRNDLAEIGLMVKEAMPRQAIEALESEMRSLAERLEDKRQAGEATLAASVERSLAEISQAVASLTPAENLAGLDDTLRALSQKVDQLAATKQNPLTIQQIEVAVAGLRTVLSHVASTDAIAKLSEDVRHLAAKVEQAPGPGFLTTLEQRIAAIADALQNRPAHGQSTADIDAVVRTLSEKLEHLQLSRGDHIAVTQLEDRIVSLAEKLDASDARLGHLETIEQALTELLVYLEKERTSGSAAPAGPEVDSLKQEMLRTQDSLEAVHGTLGHVVDRLVMIENGIRGPMTATPVKTTATSYPPPQTASSVGRTSGPVRPDSEPSSDRSPPAVTAAPAAPHGNAAPTAARRPIDPSLPPDHPLEPGVRNRSSVSPAERIAASEAALGPARPPVIDDPAGKSDFIAAARRAAQAASSDTAARDRAADPPQKVVAAESSRAARIAGRVRSFLVAASVVIIVLGSLQLVMNLFGFRQQPEEESHTGSIESPLAQDEVREPIAAALPAPAAISRDEASPPLPVPTKPQSDLSAGPAPFTMPSTALLLPVPPAYPLASAAPKSSAPAEKEPAAKEPAFTGNVRPPAVPPIRSPEPAKRPPIPPAYAAALEALPPSLGSNGLRAALAKGDAAAQYEVGTRFAEGRGITQDFKAAAEWFERAAKQGLAPAQFRLAVLQEKGTGVPKDLQSARRLYLAAGQAGNGKALHNLAVLYAEGIDGKPDYATAAKWFRKAADYGITDSQYNLGILFAGGIGVQANLAEAYKWLELAARAGDKESAVKRDEIGARLDQASLAGAREAAQSWAREPQPELAIEVKPPPGGWDTPAAPLSVRGRPESKGPATKRLAQ